jgi:hypothetical protein
MATEAAEGQWARDLLETELARAGEEGLTKRQLQERLSIGTEDLRTGLELLGNEGLLQEKGERIVLTDPTIGQRPDEGLEGAEAEEEAALGEVMKDDDADAFVPPEEEAEEEAVPGLAEAAQQVATTDGFYRSRLMLDVSFKPDAPGGDDAAVRDAEKLLKAAEAGVRKAYPDLAIASGVVSVDAFDEPRHVWP